MFHDEEWLAQFNRFTTIADAGRHAGQILSPHETDEFSALCVICSMKDVPRILFTISTFDGNRSAICRPGDRNQAPFLSVIKALPITRAEMDKARREADGK
jgi:hypothetical protein